MGWWSQNLDSKPGDGWDASGSKLMHGRGRLYFGNRDIIRLEWSLRDHSLGTRLCIGDAECEVAGHISLLLGTLYWGFPCPAWLDRLFNRGYHSGREFDASFHHGSFYWKFFARDGEWSSVDPWWMSWSVNFKDVLLGRMRHSEDRILETRSVVIPMPEGTYDATVVMKLESWKRLLGRRHRVIRAHIDVPVGIPFPGKGENSWDCGPDATFGLCCSADTPEEAIGRLVASVLRDRQRNGGSHTYTKRDAA